MKIYYAPNTRAVRIVWLFEELGLPYEIERFKLFGKAGLTEIALRLHDDPMDGLKIIGEQVVPALRA